MYYSTTNREENILMTKWRPGMTQKWQKKPSVCSSKFIVRSTMSIITNLFTHIVFVQSGYRKLIKALVPRGTLPQWLRSPYVVILFVFIEQNLERVGTGWKYFEMQRMDFNKSIFFILMSAFVLWIKSSSKYFSVKHTHGLDEWVHKFVLHFNIQKHSYCLI